MPAPAVARVVFNLPVAGPFDYVIPEHLRDQLRAGARVAAPFGRRRLIGYVTGLAQRSAVPPARLRALLRVLDAEPWFTPELLALADWLSETYLASPGECLAAIVPTRLPAAPRATAMLEQPAAGAGAPTPIHTDASASLTDLLADIRAHRHTLTTLEALRASRRHAVYVALLEAALAAGRSGLWLVPDTGALLAARAACAGRWPDALITLDGRATPRQASLVNTLGARYAVLDVRISPDVKYGGNFLLHQRHA